MSNQIFQQQYDISEWGFLSNPNTNMQNLPTQFDEYIDVINLIQCENGLLFRNAVDNLEKGLTQDYYVSKINNLSMDELKHVYLVFTFIAQKYTKCLENKLQEIPYEIGLPWYHSAQKLGLPCVLTYAASILYNCKLDETGKLSTIYSISGTSDELHFYKVHITLENTCGNLIKNLLKYIENSNDLDVAIELAQSCKKTITQITTILKTMYDECEPEKFWKQVRLYLSGYTKDHGFPNGLKIKETDISFNFGGGSAAQSSLIQLIDIILSVEHESEHGKKFLLEQREYMPKSHRDFLVHVENYFKHNPLKTIAMNNLSVFIEYNCAIRELKVFRQAHYKLVHDYIVKFIKTPEEEEKGSGGLMFKELTNYIKDTSNTKLKLVTTNTHEGLTSSNKNNWWLWLCGTICVAYCISQIVK